MLPLLGAVALAVQYVRNRRQAARERVPDDRLAEQFELADRIDAQERLARKRRRRDRR